MITGGSEGMGKAVACQLAEKGANVVIVSRTVQKLEEAIEAIKVILAHIRCSTHVVDVLALRDQCHQATVSLH